MMRFLKGLLVAALASPCASAAPLVYVAPIEGIIDLGLAPFVQRVLDEAAAAGAAAVVLEINTFGGRVDAAVRIRDALLSGAAPQGQQRRRRQRRSPLRARYRSLPHRPLRGALTPCARFSATSATFGARSS